MAAAAAITKTNGTQPRTTPEIPVTKEAIAMPRDRALLGWPAHIGSIGGRVDVSLTVDGDVRGPLGAVEVPVLETAVRVAMPAGGRLRILPFHWRATLSRSTIAAGERIEMEIVLIRHGEPEWVRDGLNVVDPPLTERGLRQAERVAAALDRRAIRRDRDLAAAAAAPHRSAGAAQIVASPR